jgi:hypothetical protein
MQATTFNVTQINNCAVLQVLVQMQQCTSSAGMLRYCDNLLDELNDAFEADMEACALTIDDNGDVQYTTHMTYGKAQQTTARIYADVLHAMVDSDGEDADFDDLQHYAMLAVVQRNFFVQQNM